MENSASGNPPPAERVPFLVAADLQNDLMTATNDLDRLQTLLSDACSTLQRSFFGVWQGLEQVDAPVLAGTRIHLGSAVTALQFQDIASQLIEHLRRRLRHCTDRLARDAMAEDEDGAAALEDAPLRPNPVTQTEMDTGFVELF